MINTQYKKTPKEKFEAHKKKCRSTDDSYRKIAPMGIVFEYRCLAHGGPQLCSMKECPSFKQPIRAAQKKA